MKTKLIFSILLSVMCTVCCAQNRDVVWLHGLNGEQNAATLNNYAADFNARFARIETSFAPMSIAPTRSAGVQAIADAFRNQLTANPNAVNDEIILVGHSMGGMISKELDIRARTGRANGLNVRGIITLGSPLNGARIANSMASPLYHNWMLGPGAPVNSFASNVAYNLGRCTLPGGAMLSTYLYNNFMSTAQLMNATVSFATSGQVNLWSRILPLSGQSWEDLKTTGYSATSNITTPTPKLNLWANIPRPALQTVMTNSGMGNTYQNVVNYTRTMYDVYRWVPGLGAVMAREAIAAEGYFLFTIHGQYTNLIAGGVTYEWRSQNYHAKQNVTTCWQQSRQVATQSCRRWGWFRWLCSTVVQVVSFTTCTTNEIIATHTVMYQFPTYPDTDGVVAAESARADGSQWRGVPILVEDTDHSQLVQTNSRGDLVLRAIFNGLHPDIAGTPDAIVFGLN